jgi:hypothetical protein
MTVVTTNPLPAAPAHPGTSGFACKLEELDRIYAFADACGFQDELFHVVIAKWEEAKKH